MMVGDATAGIAERSRAAEAACPPSHDFLLEDDSSLERNFTPGMAPTIDFSIEGVMFNIVLGPNPQSAAQTHGAATRVIGHSGGQGGPRQEDR